MENHVSFRSKTTSHDSSAADIAFARIVIFMASHDPHAILLAAHAAVLETLRPEILSLIRVNFIPGPNRWNPALDAEVLYGPLSQNLGGGYFELDKEVRQQLLVALEAWSSNAGDQVYRAGSVGRLLRQYVRRERRSRTQSDSPRFLDFLKQLDWLGLAYDKPFDAAQALMRLVSEAETQLAGGSLPKIRFAGVASLLALPLSAFGDGIDSARAVDAMANDDLDRARVLFGPMMHQELAVGRTKLIAPQVLLNKYMLSAAHRKALADSISTQSRKMGEKSLESNISPFYEEAFDISTSKALDEETMVDSKLHRAVRAMDLEGIKQLLFTGKIDPDKPGLFGKTALHLAAQDGHIEICRILLDGGATVDSRDQDRETPLHKAASFGREAVVDLLIDHGSEINAKSIKERTPLIFAAYYRHPRVAAKLLQSGADPYWRASDGWTPACAAAAGGSLTILAWLQAKGAPLEGVIDNSWRMHHLAACSGQTDCIKMILAEGYHKISDRNLLTGCTALHYAVGNGHRAAVELLLELGDEPDAPDNYYWCPLHYAASANHADIIHILISFGASPTNRIRLKGYTPLHIAVLNNSAQATKALLKSPLTDPNATAFNLYPLLIAAENGFAETIKVLLACSRTDRKVKKSGKPALFLAIKSKSLEAVDTLLKDHEVDANEEVPEGKTKESPLSFAIGEKVWDIIARLVSEPRVNVDIEVKGKSILYHSVEAGAIQAVQAALDRGLNPHEIKAGGYTLLHLATRGKSIPVVDLMLAAGMDLEAQQIENRTPLFEAVEFGDLSTIDFLVERGVNFNHRDITGRTSLIVAIAAGLTDKVHHLLGIGADLDLTDNYDRSPLHIAAMVGDADLIHELLEAGASLDSRDRNGMMALHLVVRSGNLDGVRLLINMGANINARAQNGWTPLHFAAQVENPAIAEFLISHGADPVDAGAAAKFMPLQAAAEVGAIKVCKCLLATVKNSGDVSSYANAAIGLAAANCQFETVLFLLDAGASIVALDRLTELSVRDLFANHMAKQITLGVPVSEVETTLSRRLGLSERQVSFENVPFVQDQKNRRQTPSIIRAWQHKKPQRLIPSSLFPPGWFTHGLLFQDPDADLPSPWVVVRGVVKDRLIDLFNKKKKTHIANLERTQVCASPLSFYQNVSIIRFRDQHWENSLSASYFLYYSAFETMSKSTSLDSQIEKSMAGLKYSLNGTSAAIDEINTKAPIRLNERNVLDYVRFFNFFVRREEGPLYILEDNRDFNLPSNIPESMQNVIDGIIRPAHYEGMTKEGKFIVDSIILYSNVFFQAVFEVAPSGMVKVLNNLPLAGDLPVRINVPLI